MQRLIMYICTNNFVMSLLKKLFHKRGVNKADSAGVIDIKDSMFQETLYYESVCRHQSIQFPRFTKENPATLGFLIETLFPDCQGKIKCAINLSIQCFTAESQSSLITNPKDIEAICPIDEILYVNNEGEELPRSGLNNTYLIRFNDEAPIAEVLFHFRCTAGFAFNIDYVRVSVMVPPLGQKDNLHSGIPGADKPIVLENHAAEHLCFMIVEDRSDNRKIINEYESIERSIDKKLKTGEKLTEQEQNVHDGYTEFKDLSDYIGYGRWLQSQERWTDAYRQFIRVWHISHNIINNHPEQDHSWLYELAFDIGKCLSKLERFEEAVYFLQLASEKKKEAEDEIDIAYIHLGDIRIKESSIHLLAQRRAEINKATESSYVANKLSMGDLLGELFGAMPGSLTGMIICRDDDTIDTRISDAKDVWNTPLAAIAAANTTALVMYRPVGYITGNEADKSILCTDTSFVIRVNKAMTGQEDGLLRINIMLPAFNPDPTKMFLQEANIPEGISIIVGTSEPPTNSESSNSSLFEHCNRLADSGRYFERCFEAKYIFNRLLSRWAELDESEKSDFFEAAYQIGFSYMDFRMEEKAYYYLEIASQSHVMNYMREYLNCLSNSFDPRTMAVIDSFLNIDVHEFEPAIANDWKSFLMRRKAYQLVEARKFAEARIVLNTLLEDSDPVNQQYAKAELQYINGHPV